MLSFEQLCQAVRDALRRKLGSSWGENGAQSWNLVATFADSCVVERAVGQFERYPVTVGATDDVTLGETPEKVGIEYASLAEGFAQNSSRARFGDDGGFVGRQILAEGEAPAATGAATGTRWACCVIVEGLSLNRTLYSSAVLQAATPLYEGATVFANHSDEQMRDPRDISGFLSNVRFGLLEAKAVNKAAVLADLNVTAGWLGDLLVRSHAAGKPDLVGLSHTVEAETEPVRLTDGLAIRVNKIVKAASVDVVSFPSAGGRVLRLAAGMAVPLAIQEVLMTFAQKLARVQESRLKGLLTGTPTETEVDALIRVLEADVATPPPAPATAPPPAPAQTDAGRMTDADRALMQEARRFMHEARVLRALEGRTLPDAARQHLRESLLGNPALDEAAIVAQVDSMVALSARLVEARPGSGSATGVEITDDEAQKAATSLDAFFMADARPEVRKTWEAAAEAGEGSFASVKGRKCPSSYSAPRSIRALSESLTGDKMLDGRVSESHRSRLRRICEAAMVTSTYTNLFGDSITRRMLAEYRSVGVYNQWRRVVSSIVPVADFREQKRLRIGSFADLNTVFQLGTYQELATPTDEVIAYTPFKKGGLVSISREAILNDDVGFVRKFPVLIALSAARTIHGFVFGLITGNPTLDDGQALFADHALRGGVGTANIQTAALSQTTVDIANQRMLVVTDRDGRTVLGYRPKLLIVPPALEKTAWELVSLPVQHVATTQASTEPNVNPNLYGLNEQLTLITASDANNAYFMADPAIANTIEIAFVQGREEPELFVQDNPTEGIYFTNDQMSWKVRHEYGGDIMDWRAWHGLIVA